MKKIYFLLLLNSVISIAQTQIGSDINGEATGKAAKSFIVE